MYKRNKGKKEGMNTEKSNYAACYDDKSAKTSVINIVKYILKKRQMV